MHSDIKVVKEAIQQLQKANTWVITALAVEGMDEEVGDRWSETVDAVLDQLKEYLE